MARCSCPCRPRLDAALGTLEFTIKKLAANEAGLPELGGTVNAFAASSPSSAAPPLAPGTTFSNATLIIDIADIETYVDPSIGEKLTVVRVARRKTPLSYPHTCSASVPKNKKNLAQRQQTQPLAGACKGWDTCVGAMDRLWRGSQWTYVHAGPVARAVAYATTGCYYPYYGRGLQQSIISLGTPRP